MIKFHDLPANEEAADNLVKEMTRAGYSGEDAQRLVDAAAGIAISTLRGLDAKINDAASDEDDRTVIQQLVMHQLMGSCERAMGINAVQHLFKMLFGRR